MLTLVFGSTTLAVSTVLTAFMGGLGLGSYLAGQLRRPAEEPGARLRARRGGDRRLRAARAAGDRALSRAQPRALERVRRPVRAAVGAALRRLGGAPARADDADGRDAADPGAALRAPARGSCGGSACASGRSTRSTCSARSPGRSSPASSSCRRIGLRWTNVTAASFNLTLAARDPAGAARTCPRAPTDGACSASTSGSTRPPRRPTSRAPAPAAAAR